MAHPVTITRGQLATPRSCNERCSCWTSPPSTLSRLSHSFSLSLSLSPSLFVSLYIYDDHPLPSGACDRYYARACPLPRYRSHLVIILDCTERSLRRCAAPDRLYLRFLARLAPRFRLDYARVSRAFCWQQSAVLLDGLVILEYWI